MIEFIKKKWIEWFVGIAICFLTVILTNHFTVKRESRSSLERTLEKKADIEYVDKQINITKDVIKQHAEESDKAQKAQLELMKSIDQKVNILLNNRK